MSPRPNADGLLDRSQYMRLARALSESPEMAITQHHLRLGNCRVAIAGTPEAFGAVIVQADTLPGEPVGYGSDAQAMWRLLQLIEGWFCIEVSLDCADALGELMARQMGVAVQTLDDLYHTLERPVVAFPHPDVRLLTPRDLPLLAAAPADLRDSCWSDAEALLAEGLVACAIVKNEVVATALTAARSDRYADIGVHAREDHRGQGLATAAASLVAREIQAAGQTPVWSAGAHNTASLHIASKLGFAHIATKRYLIPRM